MKNRFVFLAPLAAFVALLIYFSLGLTRDPSTIPSVLINRPAPTFELPPIAGRERGFSSDDLKGGVMLVNIWGSWCVACRIEHPVLMEIAARGDVPIMGIDWKDEPGAGAAWLEKWGDPYAQIGDDADGRVSIDFGVTGAPETFVVDHNGRIRYKHIGPITEQFWREDIEPVIERLKDEAAVAGADRADAADGA